MFGRRDQIKSRYTFLRLTPTISRQYINVIVEIIYSQLIL